jgi:hypothetical protein
MTPVEAFFRRSLERINERLASLRRPVELGAMPDFPTYKEHTGQIKALLEVTAVLEDEYRKLTMPEPVKTDPHQGDSAR